MIEKGAEVNNCIIMEGGRIMTEASLRHVITDRNVIIRDGRTMMGHENYPITIAKTQPFDPFLLNPHKLLFRSCYHSKNAFSAAQMFVKYCYITFRQKRV